MGHLRQEALPLELVVEFMSLPAVDILPARLGPIHLPD